MAIRLWVVSAMNKLDVPALFWIWKAVVESAEFCDRTVPVNLLLPVKVCGPVPFNRATLALKRESLKVPDETLDALRLLNPAPLPVKELEALENVLLPLKVWLAPSKAMLAASDKLEVAIWTPPTSYWPVTLRLVAVTVEPD